jgi:Amidohydrolase
MAAHFFDRHDLSGPHADDTVLLQEQTEGDHIVAFPFNGGVDSTQAHQQPLLQVLTSAKFPDIAYIVREAGEDNLVIGTDYGHTDSSSDLDAINVFRRRDDLSPAVKEKILSDNARSLYAL